jgi:hypothetical protein
MGVMVTDDSIQAKKVLFTIALISGVVIMFELVISRMAVFYLNYANSFLAIPMALFGLAIGSLHVHLSKNGIEKFSLKTNLFLLTLFSFLSFASVFFIFSRMFQIRSAATINATAGFKLLAFVIAFIPFFYIAGKILTVLFTRNKDAIGKLYAWDLGGAGIACFLTPILFHFINLPQLIFVGISLLGFVTIMWTPNRRKATAVVMAGASLIGLFCLISLEKHYDLSMLVKNPGNNIVTEIASKWNEYSRVSLLKIKNKKTNRISHQIIHDNAESNVGVVKYRPNLKKKRKRMNSLLPPSIPLDSVKDILVMFAGCGRQMVLFNEMLEGKANITGVELNPLVRDLAVKSAGMDKIRLQEFYDLPNIDLRIQEGRYFLENDPKKYDLIFVASQAATSQVKTGHSRKYLDTKEALAQYLDHLRPGGTMVFSCQPHAHRVESLKALYAERGLSDLSESLMVTFHQKRSRCSYTLAKTQPLKENEKAVLLEAFEKRMAYLPGYADNNPKLEKQVMAPVAFNSLVTDDTPYIKKIDFASFQFLPDFKTLKQKEYYRSWMKIITLFFVALMIVGILLFLYIRKIPVPPPNLMAVLLITGFTYMLCEIAFIAKLELFMGNPLYSMALLLSIFLFANAIGSNWFNKGNLNLSMAWFPLIVGAILLITDLLIGQLTGGLGWPLTLKIPVVIVLLMPTGICLGMFFPFVVSQLAKDKNDRSIPITYGISTLASVAGATVAMTLMINYGFTALIHLALYGYLALGVGMFIFTKRQK